MRELLSAIAEETDHTSAAADDADTGRSKEVEAPGWEGGNAPTRNRNTASATVADSSAQHVPEEFLTMINSYLSLMGSPTADAA